MPNPRTDASATVGGLAIAGVLASIVGLFLTFTQRSDGNAFIAYLGVAVAAVGQFALLAAMVGWGVYLGIRWAGLTDDEGRVTLVPRRSSAPTTSYLDEDGR